MGEVGVRTGCEQASYKKKGLKKKEFMHGFQISQLSTWRKLPGLEKRSSFLFDNL